MGWGREEHKSRMIGFTRENMSKDVKENTLSVVDVEVEGEDIEDDPEISVLGGCVT